MQHFFSNPRDGLGGRFFFPLWDFKVSIVISSAAQHFSSLCMQLSSQISQASLFTYRVFGGRKKKKAASFPSVEGACSMNVNVLTGRHVIGQRVCLKSLRGPFITDTYGSAPGLTGTQTGCWSARDASRISPEAQLADPLQVARKPRAAQGDSARGRLCVFLAPYS